MGSEQLRKVSGDLGVSKVSGVSSFDGVREIVWKVVECWKRESE